MASVILSQALNQDKTGINIQWQINGMATINEAIVVYYATVSPVNIFSDVLDTTKTQTNFHLTSGTQYSFQLQLTDINNLVVYSNILSLTAPYYLSPPVIQSYVPMNNGLIVTLASDNNILTTADFVEFVLVRNDGALFWIVLPYSSARQYTLTSTNNAQLVNYKAYNIACMYNPGLNSTYTAPSCMSNSMAMTPSDLPQAPAGRPTMRNVGLTDLEVKLSWNNPNDFSNYRNNYSINLGYQIAGSNLWNYVTNFVPGAMIINTPYYVFTENAEQLVRGNEYLFSVQYVNQYGNGATIITDSRIFPTEIPDAIDQNNVILSAGDTNIQVSWSPPTYTGQTAILSYNVYNNNQLVYNVAVGTTSYLIQGLTNGASNNIQVSSVNAVGESLLSIANSAIPNGVIQIQSVIVSGNNINIVVNPNGASVTSLLCLALPTNPVSSESPFVKCVQVAQYSNQIQGQIAFSIAYSNFSSAISSYLFMCSNGNGSCYNTNIPGL